MKKFLIFLLILFFAFTLYAFDFTTEIEDISMHPDFWGGLFPSYIAYKMKLNLIELIPSNETEFSVLLSTGIKPRVITQNPSDGAPTSENWSYDYTDENDVVQTENLNSLKLADYDTMASSWALTFGQGFGERKVNFDDDPYFFWVSFDGEWEQSLNPILQGLNRNGYPFEKDVFDFEMDEDGKTIAKYNELIGTPDLQGDRQMLSMNFNLGATVTLLELDTASIQGVDAALKFTYAPESLSSNFKGNSDFFKISLWAKTGYTIYQKFNEQNLNKMSLVVTDDFEFRFLNGDKIPKYAEETYGQVWMVENINSPVFLRNSFKLYYYGEQFLNGFAVPSLILFLDVGFNGGNLNNTNLDEPLNYFTGSYGIQINIKMFNFLYIYYELGHIFSDNPGTSQHFTSSETIKFLIQLDY